MAAPRLLVIEPQPARIGGQHAYLAHKWIPQIRAILAAQTPTTGRGSRPQRRTVASVLRTTAHDTRSGMDRHVIALRLDRLAVELDPARRPA